MIRAFVVDDEPLAVKRLVRLLQDSARVELAGSSTDPVDALAALIEKPVDLLFLDIQMPGMDGFEMLGMLEHQPLIVFTTAFDQYALQAFEVNSIDYLLKPVEEHHLARALDKAERLRASAEPPPEWKQVLQHLAMLKKQPEPYPERIASRIGERIHILELQKVLYFFAQDKLTYAATESKNYVVDHTIAELEERLDPRQFCRIHRSSLLNLAWAKEVDAWFGGRFLVRLKDAKSTELQVSRERAADLKSRLSI